MNTSEPGCEDAEDEVGYSSWSLLNKRAWNATAGELSLFEANTPQGYIGSSSLPSLVKCLFPCDGSTGSRSHHGCGCHGKTNFNYPLNSCGAGTGGWNWCNAYTPWEYGMAGHVGCALHPNQTGVMLRQFSKYMAQGPKPDVYTENGTLRGNFESQWFVADLAECAGSSRACI